jgi:hypothetical protein
MARCGETPAATAARRSQFRIAHHARCHGLRLPAGHLDSYEGALPGASSPNPLRIDSERQCPFGILSLPRRVGSEIRILREQPDPNSTTTTVAELADAPERYGRNRSTLSAFFVTKT